MLDTEFFRRIISAGRLGPKTAKKSKIGKSTIFDIIIFWGAKSEGWKTAKKQGNFTFSARRERGEGITGRERAVRY